MRRDDRVPGRAHMTAVEEVPETTAPSAERQAETRHFQRATLFLVLNTGVTGVSGALFWLLAARYYDVRIVGPAVAASSLLLALAFAAQLNVSAAISRFLPGAGSRQRATLLSGYRTALLGAVLCALGVVVVGVLRHGEVVRGSGWTMTAVLAGTIPFWVIFALQDNALVSVRRSQWIPLENGLVTLAKYALLPLCAIPLGGAGILLAWVLPIAVAIPVVNAALFRRYLHSGTEPIQDRRGFVAFALRDMPGQVSILVAMRIVPLLVVEELGAREGAFIGLPWSILTVAALALPTLALSLLSELSREGADTQALRRRSTLLIGGVLFPGTVVAALLAHPVLQIASPEYANRGASVLAWGALGLAPGALVETRLAVFRAESRVWWASALQVLRSVALLGVIAVLVHRGDVSDFGIAFFGVNLGALLIVLLTARLLKVGWNPATATSPAESPIAEQLPPPQLGTTPQRGSSAAGPSDEPPAPLAGLGRGSRNRPRRRSVRSNRRHRRLRAPPGPSAGVLRRRRGAPGEPGRPFRDVPPRRPVLGSGEPRAPGVRAPRTAGHRRAQPAVLRGVAPRRFHR